MKLQPICHHLAAPVIALVTLAGLALTRAGEERELSAWIAAIRPGGAIVNPEKLVSRGNAITVAVPVRDRSVAYFIAGLPAEDLVDGSHRYLVARPDGVYRYLDTEGGERTIRRLVFVRWGKPSDRAQP